MCSTHSSNNLKEQSLKLIKHLLEIIDCQILMGKKNIFNTFVILPNTDTRSG